MHAPLPDPIDAGRTTGRPPRRHRRRLLVASLAVVATIGALALPSSADDLSTPSATEATTTTPSTPTTTSSDHVTATDTTAPIAEVGEDADDPTAPITNDDPIPTEAFWDQLDAAAAASAPDAGGPAPTEAASAPSAVFVPAAPAITVTPATNLVQGDVVTIDGTGFPAGAFLAFVQCGPGTGQEACNLGNIRYVNADASGSFSVQFTPRRILRTLGVDHDCAIAGTCSIGGGTVPDGSGGSATAPIQFDPSIPPPPPPSITVTPTTDLLDRQSVTVTGADFPSNSPVGVVECLDPPTWGASTNCDLRHVGFTFTEADGSFSLTYEVRRLLRTDGSTTDCADPGVCVLAAGVNDPTDGDAVSIQFDPSVPLPPPPTVTVAPTTDLLDGDTVTVTGSGFDAGTPVLVSQCPVTEGSGPPGCAFFGGIIEADDSGAFTTELVVDRLVYLGADPIDCADPDACVVVVFDLLEGYEVAAVPIQFDPSVPPPPPPTLVATPSTGLADGQTVTLHGSGYPRNRQLGMAQCLTDVPNSPGCDLTNYKFVQTDDQGAFTTTFTVKATYLSSGRGPVDCRTAPGICRIGAGLTDGGLGASALLTFGGSTTPPAGVQAADAVATTPAFTG